MVSVEKYDSKYFMFEADRLDLPVIYVYIENILSEKLKHESLFKKYIFLFDDMAKIIRKSSHLLSKDVKVRLASLCQLYRKSKARETHEVYKKERAVELEKLRDGRSLKRKDKTE
jgi:hypothetical protein